jgi:predicted RNA-binding Zn-ribbon protein involved in translation (DUF1610 family)
MDFDKRMKHPAKFVLEKDKLAIGIIDREYGILCPNCGSIEFSEDEEFTKIICSNCGKIIAIRAITDVGWVNEEESDE